MCENFEKCAVPESNTKDSLQSSNPEKCNLILIEPFYGGSHKQLIDTLVDGFQTSSEIIPYVVTLPAKKWHWRARTSALYLSQIIPTHHSFKTLFTSSVLNLAELIALRPDLSDLRKVVYFHENQLVYPVRKAKDRDFQYGYNQILTCLVADAVLFNSKYNQDSFLNSINKFLKLQPDYRPKDVDARIVNKCQVLYFPLRFPVLNTGSNTFTDGILHIVWPHRWEHDKDPETFFRVLFSLKEAGFDFRVSVLGESFSEVPAVFSEAQTHLGNQIIVWGHLESKESYYTTLAHSHVAVSTAKHEFYGIAMLEAAYCGCFPLCPNKLVYPELYPAECLYNDERHLKEILTNLCKNPELAREMRKKLQVDFRMYRVENLFHKYTNVLFL